MTEHSHTCPLCGASEPSQYHQDKKRTYLQCNQCQLVFVPAAEHLSNSDEKAEYDKHKNDLEDAGYLKFLSRMMTPISERVPAPATGLDFGCGPAPALAHAMSKQGYEMQTYDLYYQPDQTPLSQQYDFVTSTEVIEHIAEPNTLFPKLLSLLKPNAYLGLMTKLVIDQERFKNWHYKNDPTHICFYSKTTFEFVAQQYDLEVEFVGSDVIIFRQQ